MTDHRGPAFREPRPGATCARQAIGFPCSCSLRRAMKATETARRKNFHSNPPQIFPPTPPAHSSQPSKKVAAASCRCRPSPLIHPGGMTARSRLWSKATPPVTDPNYPRIPEGCQPPILIDTDVHRRVPYPRTTNVPTPPRTNQHPDRPSAFAPDGARLCPVCGISRSNATEAPRTWRKSTRWMGVDRSNHPCPPCIHPLQNTLPLSPTP